MVGNARGLQRQHQGLGRRQGPVHQEVRAQGHSQDLMRQPSGTHSEAR